MKIGKLSLLILIPLAVGAISGFFTAQSVESWYRALNKPSWNPPNYLFGPVWTVLYVLMGYSSYRIFAEPASEYRTKALRIYFVQLFLNFCWSFLFFYFEKPGLALIEIIILWLCILFMIIRFYRVDRIAAFLNIPYILWVSFATALNAAIYLLN